MIDWWKATYVLPPHEEILQKSEKREAQLWGLENAFRK